MQSDWFDCLKLLSQLQTWTNWEKSGPLTGTFRQAGVVATILNRLPCSRCLLHFLSITSFLHTSILLFACCSCDVCLCVLADTVSKSYNDLLFRAIVRLYIMYFCDSCTCGCRTVSVRPVCLCARACSRGSRAVFWYVLHRTSRCTRRVRACECSSRTVFW